MRGSHIFLIVIVAIVLIAGIAIISNYNTIITKQENVESKLADLDVMLQRRADLIPNLVNTVKGYTSHESEIIEKVTSARAKLANAGSVEEKSSANNELTQSLGSLMMIVENYPDLKASENYKQFSDELAGTENRIAVARKDYNNAVKSLNTTIKRFPGNIIANFFGIEQAVYFEANEKSAEVPNVTFE